MCGATVLINTSFYLASMASYSVVARTNLLTRTEQKGKNILFLQDRVKNPAKCCVCAVSFTFLMLWWTVLTKMNFREKSKLPGNSLSLRKVGTGIPGGKDWSRNHRGIVLTVSLSSSCPAYFLTYPKPTGLRMVQHTLD